MREMGEQILCNMEVKVWRLLPALNVERRLVSASLPDLPLSFEMRVQQEL